jgi:hypothetical protein
LSSLWLSLSFVLSSSLTLPPLPPAPLPHINKHQGGTGRRREKRFRSCGT